MGFTLRDILGAAQARAIEARVEEPVVVCPTGKTIYPTKADARKALIGLNRKQTRMRCFRCVFGGNHYHLGHRRGTV